MSVTVRYAGLLNAKDIFGMVGRCGGGYNTLWEDWSARGRIRRQRIMEEFEIGMNKICGHYEKLEQSILSEGFRNPIIITCGYPLIRKMIHLPPEMRTLPPEQLLLLEGGSGGSRLWIAQQHDLKIPCIVNDRTNRFDNCTRIISPEQAGTYYTDVPKFDITSSRGIREHSGTATHTHLDGLPDESLIPERGKLWINTMRKYGYRVNLHPKVKKMIYGK